VNDEEAIIATRLPALGFVGFGEAGCHLAKGLRESAQLFAYDVNAVKPLIRQQAEDTGTTLVDSPAALAEATGTILSVVTANAAVEAAQQNAPHLTPRHIYADLNSVSPNTKRQIASIVGDGFVEGAIMAPVPPQGHRVPILINGPAAPRLLQVLSSYGMRIEMMDSEIGAAAAVKMCRSIMVKGIEALIFECAMGASHYDAADRVFASLDDSFPGMNFRKLADYMIGRVVVHGERRAREMEEVAETLRDADIEPIMAEATARRQDWSARLGLRSHFGPQGPATFAEVLDAIAKVRKAKETGMKK
jgi:3-hydroxyisobutyrate dehydrogenase-like beta-hydroxyacid dehydrogenase